MADNEYDINIDSEDTFSVNLDNGNNNYSIEINPTDTYEIQLNEQGPQGNRGETGNGIVSYEKTGTDVLVDIYTITFTDGNTQTVRVSNGKGIANITGPVTDVLKDTYTIHYNDNTTSEYYVYNGKGIVNITGPSSSGLTDIYTINYNDGTTSEFEVENGNGITDISKTSTEGLVDTYTINFSNGNDTTFTVTNGEKGDTGNGISNIELDTTSGGAGEDTTDYIVNYTDGNADTISVYNSIIEDVTATITGGAGTPSVAVTDTINPDYPNRKSFNFNFENLKGDKGDTGSTGPTGNGISSITYNDTLSSGLVDIYDVNYTNGESDTISVTNGEKGDTGNTGATGNGISSISKTSTSGLVDTYTITYTNGNDTTFDVTNGEKGDTGNTGATGNGISSITKTSTSGLVDTYTVDYTNGNDTTFTVTNGKDGIDGQDGANGADGFSPIATVTSTNTGATVSITDKNGTTTSNINDGFSPTATVSKSGTVTTITITDKNGTTTENVYDGEGSITDVKVDNTSVVTSGVANIDLTDYQKKDTAVTHTNNTSVGSTTQPVYVDTDGTVKQTTYQLNKTVPSDAVFTDTTYSEFTGADTVSGGTSGLVPAPTTSDVDKYLKGDGSWATVTSGVSDVQVDGTSITSSGVANIVTNTAYNETTNKIATMSDLPADEIFVVTYNSSTFADVAIAISQNKQLVFYKSSSDKVRYSLNYEDGYDGSPYFRFYLTDGNSTEECTVRSNNVWSSYTFNMQTTTNLVTSVSSSSTDIQYPSAKCVYNSIKTKQDIAQPMNTLSTSGTITLTDNSINTITPTAAVTFTLPTVTDATTFHQILVQMNLSTLYSITLGTSYYFNNTAPDLSSTGVYNLIFEYDSALSDWVVGCVSKGAAS